MMRRLLILAGLVPMLSGPAATAEEPAGVPQAVRAAAGLRPAPHNGDFAWNSGPYSYDAAGNITHIGLQYFKYDAESRLKYAHVVSPETWAEPSFDYDAYGNMTSRNGSSIAVDGGTNHLSAGATYDAAGDLSAWQPAGSIWTYNFTYDAFGEVTEERLSTDSTPREYHVYTADEERLRTTTTSSGVSHWTVRGLDGKVLRNFQRTGSTWSVFREYAYRDGLLLTALRSDGTTEHFSLDHLGTPRLITNDSRQKLGFHTYLPFGEEMGTTAQEGEPLKFTGHERDDPAGGDVSLDYMHARYYAAVGGRFLSVDPTWDSADMGKPQSWNRYSYALNNSVRYTDPDGRCSPAVIDCVLEGTAVAGPPGALVGLVIGIGAIVGHRRNHGWR